MNGGSPGIRVTVERLTEGMVLPKYSVHIPEQTIIVDGDLLDGDPLAYWEENGRSLIM
jgi:hypothetical protein